MLYCASELDQISRWPLLQRANRKRSSCGSTVYVYRNVAHEDGHVHQHVSAGLLCSHSQQVGLCVALGASTRNNAAALSFLAFVAAIALALVATNELFKCRIIKAAPLRSNFCPSMLSALGFAYLQEHPMRGFRVLVEKSSTG